ncbi:hypothetical protein RRG08_063454 [Elysia crispata]|uniref:Uncharacterized protein n=1 Tax=Elysia crispata TaxID=231223 RepID=A0AAE1DW71_9GAST|nr:hypothetical protein RRG08_063454 [Elysia crispata]
MEHFLEVLAADGCRPYPRNDTGCWLSTCHTHFRKKRLAIRPDLLQGGISQIYLRALGPYHQRDGVEDCVGGRRRRGLGGQLVNDLSLPTSCVCVGDKARAASREPARLFTACRLPPRGSPL